MCKERLHRSQPFLTNDSSPLRRLPPSITFLLFHDTTSNAGCLLLCSKVEASILPCLEPGGSRGDPFLLACHLLSISFCVVLPSWSRTWSFGVWGGAAGSVPTEVICHTLNLDKSSEFAYFRDFDWIVGPVFCHWSMTARAPTTFCNSEDDMTYYAMFSTEASVDGIIAFCPTFINNNVIDSFVLSRSFYVISMPI